MANKNLRDDFENFVPQDINCADGSCEFEEDDLSKYPSYTEALYAKIMAPVTCGIYISRWDIKKIMHDAGDDIAIHPRKRMFQMAMSYASNKEDMEKLLISFQEHFNEKIDIYEELKLNYPATASSFDEHIEKAQKTVDSFPAILKEYF